MNRNELREVIKLWISIDAFFRKLHENQPSKFKFLVDIHEDWISIYEEFH